MLIENTLFGIVSKIEDAIAFLKEHEPPEGYYVAFSGGKDSVVMLDLVRRSGVKHDVHMNLTSVDPPELLLFVRKHYPDIDFIKPLKSMYQLIIENGIPPMRNKRYCCRFLKEHSGENRHVVTGVRSKEGGNRAKYESIDFDEDRNKTHIRPILNWLEKDIWQYIKEKELPYCSLYDEGRKRIGCVMCPMSRPIGQQRDMKRWPHIYKMYLGACNKAFEVRIKKGLKTTWNNGQEMMDWWIGIKN